jgi:hypothetical protein
VKEKVKAKILLLIGVQFKGLQKKSLGQSPRLRMRLRMKSNQQSLTKYRVVVGLLEQDVFPIEEE